MGEDVEQVELCVLLAGITIDAAILENTMEVP